MRKLKSVWILRCPGCRGHRRLERGTEVRMRNGKPDVRCPCGRSMTAKLLSGRTTDKACDTRCEGAKGHKCECSCGGENHGVSA